MTYAIPCGETFTRMADCACCGAQFERDPVFPEVASCDMCNAGESSGMERLPTDAELRDVNYQLDCGLAGVAP
jgi:hypothetical protein